MVKIKHNVGDLMSHYLKPADLMTCLEAESGSENEDDKCEHPQTNKIRKYVIDVAFLLCNKQLGCGC